MKNKKTIYILLPIVLLIWGLLIHQFLSYSSSEQKITKFEPALTTQSENIEKIDPFTINTDYRDPFLGKRYKDIKSDSSIQTERIKSEEILWPDIKYKGIVSDIKNKTKVFLIVIGENNCLMKIGETQNEIMLKNGNKDKITLKYKEHIGTFLINE